MIYHLTCAWNRKVYSMSIVRDKIQEDLMMKKLMPSIRCHVLTLSYIYNVYLFLSQLSRFNKLERCTHFAVGIFASFQQHADTATKVILLP